MGDEMSPMSNASTFEVDIERNPAAQMALALVVLGLVLAINSVLTNEWLVQEEKITAEMLGIETTVSVENQTGLDDFSSTVCVGDECETMIDDLGDAHDNCTATINDLTKSRDESAEVMDGNTDELNETISQIEASCAIVGETADAGFVGTIIIWIGIAIFFAAMILQVFAVMGKRNILTNITSIAGGTIVGFGVLLWALMLPETETDPDLGYGLWFAIIASGAGILAFFTPRIQSIIDGPPRMRANGVRSGTGMSEFVLKESSCGNSSLSILADDDLIRVVKVNRVGASPQVSDLLAANRSAYTGFSHQRMDWLDDFKGIWWVLAGASLISIFTITAWFTITFAFAALMAIAQLMDPERFVISTNSGNHSFVINRWRSNRELTNLAMDLVDAAMLGVLRGNELDTDALDARATAIAERFQYNETERQKALAANAAPVIAQQQVVANIEQTVVAVPVPEQVESIEQPNLPVQEVNTPEESVASESIEQPQEEPVAEAVDEPEVELENESPVAAAVSIPPPPPLPEEIPAPTATMPLPFSVAPSPVAAPPPLGAVEAMPPPPPPGGAMPLPSTPVPVATPPPPVVVHAAPREDNLSADEKDNILDDLMES